MKIIFWSCLFPDLFRLGGMLYIIGGRNNSLSGNNDCDSVDRYDPLLDQWKSVRSLTVPRNRVGIGVIDGFVYAIGGSHGNLYLNLVEKYDADEDFWVEVAPLTIPRIGNLLYIAMVSNHV